MGSFAGKEKPKADFSNVQSGSSTTDPAAPKTAPSSASHTYTIQKGDTLSGIAKREYGNASEWRAIYEANRDKIEDPDKIFPGQTITIPARDERGGQR